MRRQFLYQLFSVALVPTLNVRHVMADTQVNSLAPLVEKTAPAVVNIYAQKLLKSRSTARLLDGSGVPRLFRDSLLFGYGKDRIENSLGSGVMPLPPKAWWSRTITLLRMLMISQLPLPTGECFRQRSCSPTNGLTSRFCASMGVGKTCHSSHSAILTMRVGDQVIAIGNPFGLATNKSPHRFRAGAHQHWRFGFPVFHTRPMLQSIRAIPVEPKLDEQGAKTCWNLTPQYLSTSGGSQGLGFARPSNMVRTIVESVVQRKPLIRPWIGFWGRKRSTTICRLLADYLLARV